MKNNFEAFFARNQNRALSYANKLTRNHDDADDLVQEAFVRAFIGFEKYLGKSTELTWLCRIMTNLYVSSLRNDRGSTEYDDWKVSSMLGCSQSLEAYALDKLSKEAIQEAVANLPRHYAEPLSMELFDDMSKVAIAEILSVSEGTVRRRLKIGKELLRSVMFEEE